MSENFFIGKRRLVPLKEVTKIVPYSREYVARLARDGRIAAAQLNRQWYIDPESLKNFFDQAQLEIQARGEYVRELRRQELDLHGWWSAFTKTQADRAALRQVKSLQKTIIVVILGMLVGMLLVRVVPFTKPETALALLGQLYAPAATLVPTHSAPAMSSWYNVGQVTEQTSTLETRQGILLFPDASTTEDVSALFSDPVVFDETGSSSGTVRLEEGSTTLPFITVPVITPPAP